MTGFTARQPAFCGTAPLPRLRPVQVKTVLHTSARGQFAKRVRPAHILNGDDLPNKLTPPTTYKPCLQTVITPKATLLSSLTSLASTGAGIFLLGFIVFVHESGHFLAARSQGIRVRTFSIGFGPTIFRLVSGASETEFTIRLLPLGGFVSFPEHITTDEETGEEVVDEDPDLLQNRPVLDRAIVISAGVVANIILAWTAIFSSITSVGLPTYDVHPGVVIANVVDASGPAAKCGLLSKDIITQIDGDVVEPSLESASQVAERIRSSGGKLLRVGISRGDENLNINVKPRCCLPDGSSSVGVQLVPNANIIRTRPKSVTQSINMANMEFTRLFRQTWRGLSSLFSNFRISSQNLSGPVGVVSMGAELARNDTASLFTFCAVISLNLAVINSLPLPALDGGQMTFLIIEALRGSPVSSRVQDAVNRTALLLFLAFSGVLFFGDLERLNVVGALQQLFG